MAIQASSIQILHEYAEGVMQRASHHADNVGAIALALLGGVIWRAQPNSIEIKQYDGDLANVLWWVSISGIRYACAYNHNTHEIEIRDRSIQGSVLHRFSNETPAADVERIFAAL